jgi:hypothetical protein
VDSDLLAHWRRPSVFAAIGKAWCGENALARRHFGAPPRLPMSLMSPPAWLLCGRRGNGFPRRRFQAACSSPDGCSRAADPACGKSTRFYLFCSVRNIPLWSTTVIVYHEIFQIRWAEKLANTLRYRYPFRMNTVRKNRTILFRLPPELDDGIRMVATRRGDAVATVARELVREGLARRGLLEPDIPSTISEAALAPRPQTPDRRDNQCPPKSK